MVTKTSDCYVSVVAPLWNDADIIEDFVTETTQVLREHYANYELVLVDDGSTDETVAIAGDLLNRFESIRLIRLSRSFGEEIALAAGFDGPAIELIRLCQRAETNASGVPCGIMDQFAVLHKSTAFG